MQRKLVAFVVFVLALAPIVAVAQNQGAAKQKFPLADSDHCVQCHLEQDYLPEDISPNDVHLQPGLSCSGCHGGNPNTDDPDSAMSAAAGFVGVPKRQDIPQFCGKCHSNIVFMRKYKPRMETDQVTQYYTSVHGKLLKKGDDHVAVCTSCHTAHAIMPASDTRSTVHPFHVPGTCNKCHGDASYMAAYKIPTDQYKQYVRSVHGIALLKNQDTGAPACNDCHGNHGAIPPGFTSIRQVCGNCHANNARYFAASKMGKAWKELEMHGCEECHGNHYIAKPNDNFVGTSDKAFCVKCHSQGDAGYKVAGAIHAALDTVVTVYDQAQTHQQEVHRIGMDEDEISYLMQESHQAIVESRTLVHTFDPTKVEEKTHVGLDKARKAIALAKAEIRDYRIRREGFGAATLFTTILVIALFLKIRQMES